MALADVCPCAEGVTALFEAAGFQADSVESHKREIVNRREGIHMDRTWLQCRFVKPLTPAASTDTAAATEPAAAAATQ